MVLARTYATRHDLRQRIDFSLKELRLARRDMAFVRIRTGVVFCTGNAAIVEDAVIQGKCIVPASHLGTKLTFFAYRFRIGTTAS
jgi:hypothetical protein